jgi:hypothetical protein
MTKHTCMRHHLCHVLVCMQVPVAKSPKRVRLPAQRAKMDPLADRFLVKGSYLLNFHDSWYREVSVKNAPVLSVYRFLCNECSISNATFHLLTLHFRARSFPTHLALLHMCAIWFYACIVSVIDLFWSRICMLKPEIRPMTIVPHKFCYNLGAHALERCRHLSMWCVTWVNLKFYQHVSCMTRHLCVAS